MADPDNIRKLWKDKSFSGSYSGIQNFRNSIEFEKGIKLSPNKIFQILREDPDILLELHHFRKRFKRREFIVHGVNKTWQSDLAEMPAYDNYQYFLLCIDIFSRKIYCRALQRKTASAVEKAFTEIFDEAGGTPEILETDQGSEFIGNKAFFKRKQIFAKHKYGENKASEAENSIKIVKLRVYRMMRILYTQDWVDLLPFAVKGINKSKTAAIGGLRPADIKSNVDDPKIDEATGYREDVDFEKQVKNQKAYERKKKHLQVSDYVYATFPSGGIIGKSYDSKVH